jgi:hypothetical protein
MFPNSIPDDARQEDEGRVAKERQSHTVPSKPRKGPHRAERQNTYAVDETEPLFG